MRRRMVYCGFHIPAPATVPARRFVWAADCKLYGGRVNLGGLSDETPIFDFNDMAYTPIEAPY